MKFLLFLGLSFLNFSSLFAQDLFGFLLPNAPSTSLELEGSYWPKAKVSKGQGSSDVTKSGFGINQQIYRDQKNLWTVGAKWQELDLHQDSEYLRDYYNHQVSVGYRRTLPDSNFWFTTLSYGSASDKPFKNSRDNTIGLNHIQKFSQKWYGVLNYSNNRTFLNNVPLPGFFYVKEMSRDKVFVVGLPFFYWMRSVSENFSISYFGILPWTHRLRIFYTALGETRPYVSFEQSPQSYFRHDREHRYDRFYWFERRIGTGVEGTVGSNVRYDLSGGYAFDRELSEGKNFSQNQRFSANLENAYFASLTLRLNL